MDQLQKIQSQTPLWTQIDHDVLIEVRTTLNQLASDIKQYTVVTSDLELRVRALENANNKAMGGWKTFILFVGVLGGLAGLIISVLNYFAHIPSA